MCIAGRRMKIKQTPDSCRQGMNAAGSLRNTGRVVKASAAVSGEKSVLPANPDKHGTLIA